MDTEKQEIIRQKQQRIIDLTTHLASPVSPIGDWKINKIYEYRMTEKPDPYDFAGLAAARQAARDEINALQAEIARLETEERAGR